MKLLAQLRAPANTHALTSASTRTRQYARIYTRNLARTHIHTQFARKLRAQANTFAITRASTRARKYVRIYTRN